MTECTTKEMSEDRELIPKALEIGKTREWERITKNSNEEIASKVGRN